MIKKIFLSVFFFILFFNTSLAFAKDTKHLWEYKKKGFNMYSVDTDIKLGEKYMKEQIKDFEKKKVPVDDPKDAALKTRLEKIMHRLAAKSDKASFPYEVHLFDKPDIANAYCLPGGKIGFFTGLFRGKDAFVDENSDDQIAAVMAHEIAHATLRHVTRRATTMQGVGLLGTAVSVGIGAGAGSNAQAVFEQAFNFGANLSIPSYSRKFEKDADQAGFLYMARAGYKPEAAIAIWEKAMRKGGFNSKTTHFLASHPSSGERAKRLRAWLPEAQLIYEKKLLH